MSLSLKACSKDDLFKIEAYYRGLRREFSFLKPLSFSDKVYLFKLIILEGLLNNKDEVLPHPDDMLKRNEFCLYLGFLRDFYKGDETLFFEYYLETYLFLEKEFPCMSYI